MTGQHRDSHVRPSLRHRRIQRHGSLQGFLPTRSLQRLPHVGERSRDCPVSPLQPSGRRRGGGHFCPSSGHLAAGTGPPCSQASSPACFALRNPSNPQPHSFYLRSGPPCFGQNHLRFCLLHFVWCKRQGADGILLTDGEETKSLQSLLCFLYVKTEFLQKGHAGLRGVRSQQRRTRHLLSKGVWAVRPR